MRKLSTAAFSSAFSGLAHAAGVAVALDGVSFEDWKMTFGIAAFAGLMSLLHSLQGKLPPRLPLAILSHMLSSLGAGAFVMIYGLHKAVDGLQLCLLIFLAGLGSARLITKLAELGPEWVQRALGARAKEDGR